MFYLFWYQWHSFECLNLNQTTINKPVEGAFSSGLWCYLGGGGWIGPTWEQFLSQSWYLTTLLGTTILAVNDPMLLNSGKNVLTQQSTGIAERFLLVGDGHWPIRQPTTSVLVVSFLLQNRFVWIELAAGRMIEETTINKKNSYHGYIIHEGVDVLIAMIGRI